MIDARYRDPIEAALGTRIRSDRPIGGGDINDAFRLDLEDGRMVFAKTNDRAPADMFSAEAKGLAFLREAEALTVPTVLACGDGRGPAFLVLEYLDSGPRVRDFDERLGRCLAALHRARPSGFGLDHDNYIGRLPQSNQPAPDWPTFYRAQRLEPQLDMAIARGLAGKAMRDGFDRLFARLPELCGPPEPPCRLHGDLWGGNLHVDARGEPALIDPAAFGGHREIDLAMMRLFGGFGSRVFDAYEEAFPLAEEHERRVPLYQLYFLMAHVNMFGSSYVPSVERELARLA